MPTTFSEAAARSPLTRFQLATATLCMAVLMCEGLDMQLLGLVAPLVLADFGAEKGAFGIAMSAALVGMGVGAWAGGSIGDLLGRRYSLTFAALAFGLATIAASTATDVWSMAVWRLVGGLGFGSAFSNALAMTGEWLPPRWRAIAITALSVGTPAGGAVAGALTPPMLAEHSWREIFVIFGFATLGLAALVLIVLRDSPSFLAQKGRLRQAEALASRVLGHEVSLATPGATDTLPADRVLSRGNLRLNLGVAAGFAASTLVAYALLNWSTTLLAAEGIALSTASYAISLSGITAIAGSLAAGASIRLFGSRTVLVVAGLSLVLVLFFLAIRLEQSSPGTPAGGIVIGIALAAMLFSAAIATIYVIITVGYPQSCRSAGIGFGIFTGRIGAIAASGFGGAVLDLGGRSTVPFFAVLIASAGLIAVAALVIDRHVDGRGAEPAPARLS